MNTTKIVLIAAAAGAALLALRGRARASGAGVEADTDRLTDLPLEREAAPAAGAAPTVKKPPPEYVGVSKPPASVLTQVQSGTSAGSAAIAGAIAKGIPVLGKIFSL